MKNQHDFLEDMQAISPEELTPAEAARLIHELRRERLERRQAEEALRIQALVLESMAEGVSVTDEHGNITYTNPAFDAMFGYERGELLRRHSSVLNSYPPEENLRIVDEILRTVAARGAWSGEFHNRQKDGGLFFTSARISPLEVGGKKHFISVQEDITERKKAEQEIQRLASFPKLNPNPVLEVDDKGEIVYANPEARRIADQLGLVEGVEAFLPTDLEELFVTARKGGPWQYSYDLALADQVYAIFLSFPCDLPTARIYALNITERQQSEEALRESEERYRSLFENNHAVMLLIDPETGAIRDANPAACVYYGYSQEELLVRRITDINTLNPEQVFLEMQRARAEDRRHFEFKHRLASGVVRDVEVFSGPILIKGRQLLYSIVHDITARKEAEEALRQAHDELEERVAARTQELQQAYEQLLREMEERQEIEEKLRESEARFAAFMEHLPGLAAMRDVEGRYLFANLAWEKRLNIEQGAWRGMTLTELWPPKRASALQGLDFQVISLGESMEQVEMVKLADGPHHFLTYRFPIRNKNGLPYMVGSISIDITERQRAAEVIREQSRQLEAFFAHSLTPVVFLDPNFNFLRVNEAYARACRMKPEDFIERNHFELFPHPENQAIFNEVVRSKIPYQVQAKPFEYPDHPEWGVTYWDWTLVPILDQTGEVDFLVFSLRDVTKRVQAEQARSRLIEILEATPDFVGIADYYGNLQYLNRAGRALVGIGEDEDITRLQVLQLHPERIGKLILEKGTPAAIREGAWQGEIALLHRDGREIPVSQVILAHKAPTGRVQFFSTIARDISDMKEAQESILRQASILNGINRIFREALASETAEDLGRVCLEVAEKLTDSRFGFIDTLNEHGKFDALAFSDPGWEMCALVPDKDPLHLRNIEPVGLLGLGVGEGKSLLVNDPGSHPKAAGTPAGHPPLTAYLGVPLLFGGQTIGLIGLGNKEKGYSLADQEAVESLAPAIVEALMHRRAQEALRVSERKLRRLADQLLTAQENERKRLAAELHDELGHALLALKLSLSAIEKKLPPEQEGIKHEIRGQLNYIQEVIQDVRRLYHDLSPGDVEDLGLTKALSTLISDFAGYQPSITWRVNLADLEGLFSLPVQTTIYRIMQEALTNIGKHANPANVAITARRESRQVHFTIEDDGAGFHVAQVLGAREAQRGVGLVAMEERVNMVGGFFNIHSRKQQGTRLTFTIPTIPEGESP